MTADILIPVELVGGPADGARLRVRRGQPIVRVGIHRGEPFEFVAGWGIETQPGIWRYRDAGEKTARGLPKYQYEEG